MRQRADAKSSTQRQGDAEAQEDEAPEEEHTVVYCFALGFLQADEDPEEECPQCWVAVLMSTSYEIGMVHWLLVGTVHSPAMREPNVVPYDYIVVSAFVTTAAIAAPTVARLSCIPTT